MNSFYKATSIIRGILEANEDVHTCVFGKTSDKDLYKKNIYPLVHINPTGADFSSSQQNVLLFDIAVLDQRDLSTNSLVEDKFNGNDNELDNFNTCHAVLNGLISNLRLLNHDGFELISAGVAKPVLLRGDNYLDGWVIEITVAMPNIMISVCD